MQWRYAAKRMNGNKVSEDKLNYILEAARLAPTSSGLQPFAIFVISSDEVKKKLQPIAMGQPQIAECSHLLVFAAWDKSDASRVKSRFDYMNEQRGLPLTKTDDYRNRLQGMLDNLDQSTQFQLNARQAYIAFGMAIAAAAEQKVDATPMEGFDNAAMDQALALPEKGLKSVSLLTLGYRDEANDWLLKLKKVRQPKDGLIFNVD